jgi:ribose transport system substrate-binding protein
MFAKGRIGRFTGLGLALLLVTSMVAACSGQEAKQPEQTQNQPAASGEPKPQLKTGTVVDLVVSTGNSFADLWDSGAKQAAETLGVKSMLLAEEKGGANQAIANLENAALKGANMASGYVSNGAIIPELAKAAKQNNTYLVYTWNTSPWITPLDTNDSYVTFLTPDNVEIGYQMAKVLFESMGGKGNFVLIQGIPGSGSSEQRTQGVEKAMKEFPNVKLIAKGIGNYNRTEGQKVMADFLVAHPQIDGVFAANDDIAVGVINALKEAKRSGVKVTGVDGTGEALDLIKTGEMTASYSPNTAWMAGFAVVLAYDALNGWKPSVPERMLYTPGLVVTGKNVEKYNQLVAGKLPVDWKKMSRILHPTDWDPQGLIRPIDPEKLWEGVPMPSGYKLPEAYKTSRDSGEFAKVEQMFKDHYKSKVFELN